MTGLIILKRVRTAYGIVLWGFSQWEDMIYVELSAQISGQGVKEDTDPVNTWQKHISRTSLQAWLYNFQTL